MTLIHLNDCLDFSLTTVLTFLFHGFVLSVLWNQSWIWRNPRPIRWKRCFFISRRRLLQLKTANYILSLLFFSFFGCVNWIGSLFHNDLISGNVDKQILYNSVISSAIICVTISAVYVLGQAWAFMRTYCWNIGWGCKWSGLGLK